MKEYYYHLKYYSKDMTREATGDDKLLVLHITTASYFDDHGCQADWTDEEVIEEMAKLGFPVSELTDATLEFENETGEAEVRNALKDHPNLIESKAFSEFMDNIGS